MLNTEIFIDKIQWYEGMFLLPQHFQNADQRIDNLLALHCHYGLTFHWGVIACHIDEADLMSGKISILQLMAILPDGTVYSMNDEDRSRLSLDLNSLTIADDSAVTIHLALPEAIKEISNATPSANNDYARYRSYESSRFNDDNTGDNGQRLPILRPNLKLLTEDYVSHRYSTFPLLSVMKADNVYQRNPQFIAPQLQVKMTDHLGTMLMALTQKIRGKIVFLNKQLQNQNDDLLSQDVKLFMRSLSMALLPFEALLKAERAHPFAVYHELCRLAGCMAMLQPTQMPPSFNAYNHNRLYDSYHQVVHYIETMLNHIQENYEVIPFDVQDRTFSLALSSVWENSQLIIGIKAQRGVSHADMALWVKNAVMATSEHVGSIRERRILGARRAIIDNETTFKLKPAEDGLFFALYCDGDFINFDETLMIFNVADTPQSRPREMMLYRILGSTPEQRV